MSGMPQPDGLLPDAPDLYHHLISQLDYMRGFDNKLGRNSHNFEKSYFQLKRQSENDWELDINPNWVVRISTPDHIEGRDFATADGYAVIGGIIDVAEGSFVEYSLGLTLLARENSEVRGGGVGSPCCWTYREEDTEWRVAKRYHFDIDPGSDDSEDKPITHLQSGGNFDSAPLPSGLSQDQVHYCSSPLDKPRLPYPPMDPVLLFEMVSDQYGSPKYFESETWSPLVRESETKLWGKYYHRISEHLAKEDRSNLFNSLISNGRLES